MKDQAAAEAAALRAAAARTSLEDSGEGLAGDTCVDVDADDTGEGSVLKMHKSKKGMVWTAFDLTKQKPCCTLFSPTGQVCGHTPSTAAGTTNFWSHLWGHHRTKWYELKKRDGKLNAAGEAEFNHLRASLAGDTKPNAAHLRVGGEFLSEKLPHSAKETLDRVVSEWCVDEDQGFIAASTPSFRFMMESAATNGKYDGCCDKTVKAHSTAMAHEGKQEAKDFHMALLAEGVKPCASGDLWSKNGTSLFGLVSHGIRRTQEKQMDGSTIVQWTMVEKLSGSVPCSKERHTGDHIAQISDQAWATTGLDKPVEQIFERVCDNGSNMIKGWNEGFLAPCTDHTLELSVNLFTHHPRIAPTLDKGRGKVGYFNSSVVGPRVWGHFFPNFGVVFFPNLFCNL